MTTEVQIKKHRRYLPHLRKVVACIAQRLGMSRSDIVEAEEAVAQVCESSMAELGNDSEQSLRIRVETFVNGLTVEIIDPCFAFDPLCSQSTLEEMADADGIARALMLADNVELVMGDEGTTIRLTKYAEKLRSHCGNGAETVQSSAPLPTASLQT